MRNQQVSLQNLENQVEQTEKLLSEWTQGSLPSNIEANSWEHLKAIIPRSGKRVKVRKETTFAEENRPPVEAWKELVEERVQDTRKRKDRVPTGQGICSLPTLSLEVEESSSTRAIQVYLGFAQAVTHQCSVCKDVSTNAKVCQVSQSFAQ